MKTKMKPNKAAAASSYLKSCNARRDRQRQRKQERIDLGVIILGFLLLMALLYALGGPASAVRSVLEIVPIK